MIIYIDLVVYNIINLLERFLLNALRQGLIFIRVEKEFHRVDPEKAKLVLTRSIRVGGTIKLSELYLKGAFWNRDEMIFGVILWNTLYIKIALLYNICFLRGSILSIFCFSSVLIWCPLRMIFAARRWRESSFLKWTSAAPSQRDDAKLICDIIWAL